MKFTWGTGIFIFLTLFLLAAGVFMVFAFHQNVNLVHRDYYQKGVDYTEQMNVDARSVKYSNSFPILFLDDKLVIDFDDSLAINIDSVSALLFRPSNSKQDLLFALDLSDSKLKIPQQNLVSGRYILKVHWYLDGLRYEVDRPVNIQ